MARKKTPKVRVSLKAALSRRLREVRQDLFGDHGGPELARRLNIPARTWYNYETGVTVPAEVLLDFIEQTGVNPDWLLSGDGGKFRHDTDGLTVAELAPIELIRQGLERLEKQPADVVLAAPEELPAERRSDYAAVALAPRGELGRKPFDSIVADGYVIGFRSWLPHPGETIAVRVEDDAMDPVLPAGSVAAIDRTVTDPRQLHGRVVVACVDGETLIRWLDLSGRHFILRPNRLSESHPLIPIELDEHASRVVLGTVIWAWSRFVGGRE